MTKISIITICYNAEETIRPTLLSVAAQSYENIEYWVIDGGSSDATLELVKSICPFAKIVSEHDRGLYDAMNKGLCRASGQYVWYLNAGDALRSKDTVKHVVQTIESQTEGMPGIVYGDTMIVNSRNQDLHLRRLRPPRRLTYRSFLKGMLVCHQAFIVNRELAVPYDLRYKLSSDYDWCLKMLEKSTLNVCMEEILVNYLQGGLSQKRHFKSLRERFHIMSRHFGLLAALAAHLSFVFKKVR